MIIGNGLIAQAFKPYLDKDNDIILFASGVSNSKLTDEDEYKREKKLLLNELMKGKMLIYFSTCSVFDPNLIDSKYILHKLEMESLVAESNNYLIIRLPNVVGKGGNPNTMFNFFFNQIKNKNKIKVAKYATRYIIDVSDVVYWTMELIKDKFRNQSVNLAFPDKFHVITIINMMEDFLNVKADLDIIESGNEYEIDLTSFSSFIHEKKATFCLNADYLKSIFEKYYSRS